MKRHRLIKVIGVLLLVWIAYAMITPVLLSGNADASRADQGEETIVGWMIDKIAAGEVELSEEDSVRAAIDEGEREFGLSLSGETKDRIVGFLQTLDTLEVGAGGYIEQAKQMYQTYGTKIVEGTNEAINDAVESAVEGAVRNFFESIRQSVQDFFQNLKSA